MIDPSPDLVLAGKLTHIFWNKGVTGSVSKKTPTQGHQKTCEAPLVASGFSFYGGHARGPQSWFGRECQRTSSCQRRYPGRITPQSKLTPFHRDARARTLVVPKTAADHDPWAHCTKKQ